MYFAIQSICFNLNSLASNMQSWILNADKKYSTDWIQWKVSHFISSASSMEMSIYTSIKPDGMHWIWCAHTNCWESKQCRTKIPPTNVIYERKFNDNEVYKCRLISSMQLDINQTMGVIRCQVIKRMIDQNSFETINIYRHNDKQSYWCDRTILLMPSFLCLPM